MVKGPCRGKKCDFWARVRLKKKSVCTAAEELEEAIKICNARDGKTLDDAIRTYWSQVGIRDMNRLCEEEPELCSKIRRIEEIATSNT